MLLVLFQSKELTCRSRVDWFLQGIRGKYSRENMTSQDGPNQLQASAWVGRSDSRIGCSDICRSVVGKL